MTDAQERRRRWAAVAAGWKEHAGAFRHVTMPVTEWMIDAIAPQPGHQVLELAAGPGDVGFLAAELIQPGGTLITSDFSPEMLTAAQERAAELGLRNVRFKQIDAQSIDLDAASLDAVLCRWGYMLMPDPVAALRETRRVLKPGGRLALAAWAAPEENPFMVVPVSVATAHGLFEPEPPGEPGPFALAEPGAIAERLAEAGFVEYEVDTIDITSPVPDVEAWWRTATAMSSRLRAAFDGRPPEQIQAVKEDVLRQAERFAQPDGSLHLPGRTWVAAATA